MKKFLIIKTSSLGDIVQSFPVIQYLRLQFPDAAIDWIVEEHCAELVLRHPQVNKVFIAQTRAWRKGKELKALKDFYLNLRCTKYDAVFDLQGNIKSGLLAFISRANSKVGFSLKTAAEWPNVFFTNRRFSPPKGKNIREDYLYLVQKFLKDDAHFNPHEVLLRTTQEEQAAVATLLSSPILFGRKKVLVAAGSAWPNKQLTEEALAVMLQKLQLAKQCGFIFAWGNAKEQATAQRLQQQFPRMSILMDKLSLPALQLLMSQLELVVSMDSLPLHLAGTTKVATYSIFGPSLAEKYRPLGMHHKSLQGICPYGRTFEKRCPVLRQCSTGACTRGLKGTEASFE